MLSEDGHHAINLSNWKNVIAATDNDAYNALVCTELAPEIGRKFVFEIGSKDQRSDKDELIFTIGGQTLLTDGLEYSQLNEKIKEGWNFSFVKINEIYTFEQLHKDRPDGLIPILSVLDNGEIQFLTEDDTITEDEETELMIFSKSKDT